MTTTMSSDLLFEIKDLHVSYGSIAAITGISLYVNKGEIVAILGRNGVGKTTTFRSIIGLTPPKSGEIIWKSEDITGLRTFQIAQRGIGLVPEDRRVFSELTVWENLCSPGDAHHRSGIILSQYQGTDTSLSWEELLPVGPAYHSTSRHNIPHTAGRSLQQSSSAPGAQFYSLLALSFSTSSYICLVCPGACCSVNS